MFAEPWNAYMENSRRRIWQELAQIIDPEIGAPITEMDLVDEIRVEGETADISFHLTMPYCPAPFALSIAAEIKERVAAVPGINKVFVHLSNHIMADEINRQVNEAA